MKSGNSLKSGTRRSESAKNKQVLSRTQSIKVNQSIKVLSRTQSLVILVLALLVVFFGVFFLLISGWGGRGRERERGRGRERERERELIHVFFCTIFTKNIGRLQFKIRGSA